MPTYSYKCTECGNAFDAQQSFSDASLTECPVCGGKLRKVFNSIGVTFNGSGFYRTDSRATEKSSTPSSSSGSSTSGSSGSSGDKGGTSTSSSGTSTTSTTTTGSTASTTP